MKILIMKIVAVLVAIGVCSSIALAAYFSSLQIKKGIEETEGRLAECVFQKESAHQVAELLRQMGYPEDSVFILEMKNVWNNNDNEQIQLQGYLDELNTQLAQTPSEWTGPKLTRSKGVNNGPTGKETYYNLPMQGVVNIMRRMGFDATNYPYWVRSDGCKMLGPYIMVAANLNVFPRGTTVPCSLGIGLVCDTGGFAKNTPYQLDIATNW